MNATRILSGFALAFVTPLAFAQADATKMFHFCKAAISLLNGESLTSDRAAQAGICLGFVDGATSALYVGAIAGAEVKPGMNIQEELKKRKVPFACLRPAAMSNSDRVSLYVNYYSNNAKAIEALPDVASTSLAIFMRALVQSSPCK